MRLPARYSVAATSKQGLGDGRRAGTWEDAPVAADLDRLTDQVGHLAARERLDKPSPQLGATAAGVDAAVWGSDLLDGQPYLPSRVPSFASTAGDSSARRAA